MIEVGQKGFLTVTSYHTIAGFVMLFFCFVQEFVALFFRPDHDSLWRNEWRISHLVIGLGTIATALSVILTGLFIIGASRYSVLVFVLTIVVVLTYVGWSERSKQYLELVPTEPEQAELEDLGYDDSQGRSLRPTNFPLMESCQGRGIKASLSRPLLTPFRLCVGPNQPPVRQIYGSTTSAVLFGFVIYLMVGMTAFLIVDLVLVSTKIPVRC